MMIKRILINVGFFFDDIEFVDNTRTEKYI